MVRKVEQPGLSFPDASERWPLLEVQKVGYLSGVPVYRQSYGEISQLLRKAQDKGVSMHQAKMDNRSGLIPVYPYKDSDKPKTLLQSGLSDHLSIVSVICGEDDLVDKISAGRLPVDDVGFVGSFEVINSELEKGAELLVIGTERVMDLYGAELKRLGCHRFEPPNYADEKGWIVGYHGSVIWKENENGREYYPNGVYFGFHDTDIRVNFLPWGD